MRTTIGLLFLLVSLEAVCFAVPQTHIIYSTENLGAGRWRCDYTVVNISLTPPIEEFTIWFGYDAYDNLVIETPNPPASEWDEIVWQPEPVLLDDGAYDAKALGAGIGSGQNVTGFAVSFDWLGAGRPGSQLYEIIDPDTFETIDSRYTIPEPATLLLLGLGTIALKRKRWPRTH